MATRGAERRGGLWAVLGGWELERPPQPRDAGITARVTELTSAGAFLLAAVIAIAAVFLTGDNGAPDLLNPLPATAASGATAVEQVAPPKTATADRDGQAVVVTVSRPTAQTETAVAASTPGAQSRVDQAALEEAAGAERRLALVATTAEAEDEIRAYLGIRAIEPLPPAFSYTVEPGDTVTKIAARFGLAEATIRFNNFDIYDPDLLEVGATLQLPVRDGVIYVVQSRDTLDAIAQNYAADVDATIAFVGNGISSPDQIYVNQTLLLVGGSASVASGSFSGAWTMPSFRWPMAVTSVSDSFGTPRGNSYGYHTGVDWPAPYGTIVGSTAPGVVSFAGWDGGYGYWVEVDHGGGVRSRYAHLSEISVEVGQWVDAGSFVGAVGDTGNSSGAHLHFEIIMQGEPVDPFGWLE